MTTTKNSMTVGELVGKILGEGNPDFLKGALVALLNQVMAVEIGQLVGAEPHERADGRTNQRNGYRERRFDTRVGTVDLAIPKLRKGAYFPSFLEPRRRSEEALLNVIQEAYVHGVSTRKVSDLVQALGVEGVSRSEVSRICASLDEQVEAFRNRPLEKRYPYLWLDATHLKVREAGRVVSNAVVVAYGLNEDGYREVIGMSVGASENETFWMEFLRSLVERGLSGVQLAISDAHKGLKKAIATVLTGASWQRCTVHFMRNVQGKVTKSAQGMVTASVRTIFNQPDHGSAVAQLEKMAEMLQDRYPQVAEMLWEAMEDILAYMHFPETHWRQIRSTNLLERLNKEIARRSDVVGIFPNPASALRLIGMVLAEQNDEWQVGRRYMSLETLAQLNMRVMEGTQPKLQAPHSMALVA
jgi:transposase-like protein